MGNRLEGKVAVVTGAGRGIGRGVALLLAEEGAKVVVCDFGGEVDGTGASNTPADQVVAEIKAAGGEAMASYGDVSKFETGRNLVQQAVDTYGKLDILCNVAGILRDRMVFNMAEEEWDAVIAVHLKGHFNTTKHAAVVMRQQRSGRIVNFASGSGLGSSGQANYSAAKEGIVGFTRTVARDMGRYGVTCNVVYPGGSTRMTATVPQAARDARARAGIAGGGAAAGRPQAAPAPAPARAAPDSAAGTASDPLNNAPMVVYLCTDAAANINGQCLGVSGWQVTLYSYPRVVKSIHKPGRWTLDELDVLMPTSIQQGLVNPAPPQEQPPSS